MSTESYKSVYELCEALLLLETRDEAFNFLKDLCTPQELNSLAERWRVCKLLNGGEFSYRQIHQMTGASLTTISRVARFLKDEPYSGYITLLGKVNKKSVKERND
ncbi:transcriptional regulator [Rickettsiales endosymbiont of Peranema trichophorum]|uniref:YerC/YecD family TrpR-related protein n=1 Tax=Rickettsiales endosymbiont of Peranema trichophorum TaxID=2486577 RepID=UPI001023815B|nr:YerC/YecD family TrpR-related protein [Rickettsiales endosymbiont of Peranema trichophorum]RZI46774.1 transcriptional regulator [Rickettsiales endosymbiont of Peranema trichophorum]